MNNKQKVEYAPLDALGKLLSVPRAEVVFGRPDDGDGFKVEVRLPEGYVGTRVVTVTAPSLGLLVRALDLVDRGGEDLARVVVGEDGELVDADEKERRWWGYVKWDMGPVLELPEMPEPDSAGTRVRDLARVALLFDQEANGWTLPDHLLNRAAAAVDLALRTAIDGRLSAPVLVCLIAAQFHQVFDGGSPERKALIWDPIDTAQRFDLPEPWGRRFGRFARECERVWRGGVEGKRFLSSRAMAVVVPEEVYQAATGYPWGDLPLSWEKYFGVDGGDVVRLDGDLERLVMCPSSAAIRLGPVWLDEFYVDALRELGAEEVVSKVSDHGSMVVASGVAAVMGLKPEAIEDVRANGPTKDPRPTPEVGERYLVSIELGGGRTEALVLITYVSDQHLLAVCEAQRGKQWRADGLEGEWSTSYGNWKLATEEEVAEINKALATEG